MAGRSEWTSTSLPYVRPQGTEQADPWAEEAAQSGRVGTHVLREVAEITPPEDIAAALKLSRDDTVIVRRRVVLLDDEPVELADSYYPAAIAGGTRLADPRKVPGGATKLLADLGYHPILVEEDITARPASDEERQLLQIPDLDWVLVLTRRSMAQNGTPVEVMQMSMVAHGRHLRYSLAL
ncbi:hypothetical protein GCM10022419_045470 [Nonomuraea rosea]|uniref:UbiC transcription regulator-associated domain-containing protein n=1 Tax=Nonomuraea rosea TaxID=638574 RepID=A0ABP6X0X3_9ACTN